MNPIKIVPLAKDCLWGGSRLKADFGIQSDLPNVAEAWMLSPTENTSVIASGELAGQPITALLEEGEDIDEVFPLMIKFIDAAKPLSVQVHPNDEYAGVNYGTRGKNECWYVLDAQPGAYLYYGFSRPVNKEEVKKRIEKGTLIEVLNKIEVKKHDIFFIRSGTLHAIGPGVLVAEIQQNSPLTFRVYDYMRLDKNGNPRELHIKEALDCMSLNCNLPHSTPQPLKAGDGYQIFSMVNCKHFDACIYRITKQVKISGTSKKWRGILVTEGALSIRNMNGSETIEGRKGEFFLVPRNDDQYEITGEAEFILAE
ncbi:MAG: class I mannose-6-phosphate isomerase [Clostridiales bacterium]|nr:class I mannose-6-phosphate isomerase [Clostridiales bacterium]